MPLKKIILRILSVVIWFYTFGFICTSILLPFVDDAFRPEYIIIFVFFTCITGLLGLFLWKKSNSITDKAKNKKIDKEEVIKITTTFEAETPESILNEMKKYYSPMQAKGDIRILSESVELIKNTKNIDTFVSRFELAQRISLTLEQAVQAGIEIPSNFTSYRELYEIKQTYAPKILKIAYEKVKEDALKLKTEKGQLNRFQKFFDDLVENDNFFEEFVEYDEILESLNKDIASYTTSNFGG